MRRKMYSVNWVTILFLVLLCSFCYSRPQTFDSKVTQDAVDEGLKNNTPNRKNGTAATPTPGQTTDTSRDVKSKTPVIGDSIKMVTSQLLENINATDDAPIISDMRIPPKLKSQIPTKNKQKTRIEDSSSKSENSHAGVAVPISLEEIENENKLFNLSHESSTPNEGISTWILLTNPANKDDFTTEPIKFDETTKKPKPTTGKNKTKRPAAANKISSKNPIIAAINKSDLIAGGSAISDNVLNKIKDTVMISVQKNKGVSTTRVPSEEPTTEKEVTTKKEIMKTQATEASAVTKTTLKPKKKNKIKPTVKTTTVPTPSVESALLPMEPKEQEIELEVSTPAPSTKKTKKTSSKRKKNKTKKRKTGTKNSNTETAIEIKSNNKTKTAKPSKAPGSPITTQIYNYLSREVMPSVGVGVIGLAGLVGVASYFLYPFVTPVRRTFEVDKKDDLYRFNAEEYANEGNGQAEEEMLGTVLAGMPAHSKNRLNPYAGQSAHTAGPVRKDQDLRYRYVANTPEAQHYNNIHYPQQKTGIAHGAMYPDSNSFVSQTQENRHAYSTDGKYAYEQVAYTPYPAAEPIYAASQPETPEISGYANDVSNSVVYGVKPSSDSEFKPVYPFEGQVFSETTNVPPTYPPTSLYLGSNNESEEPKDTKYAEDKSNNGGKDMFVVGNVPKDFVDAATPAVVPEHGPRKLRRKRDVPNDQQNAAVRIEQILNDSKNDKNILSNEIDAFDVMPLPNKTPAEETTTNIAELTTTTRNDFVESIYTLPLDTKNTEKTTTETDLPNDLDTTTKSYKVYEVFTDPAQNPTEAPKLATIKSPSKLPTETTLLPHPETTTSITGTKPTYPNVITYPPPIGTDGFFSFLKRLIEFKYRLGMSILQSTSESLNRYLRNMDNSVHHVARASQT